MHYDNLLVLRPFLQAAKPIDGPPDVAADDGHCLMGHPLWGAVEHSLQGASQAKPRSGLGPLKQLESVERGPGVETHPRVGRQKSFPARDKMYSCNVILELMTFAK